MPQQIYDIKPPEKKKEIEIAEKKKRSPRFFIGLLLSLLVVFGVYYFFSYRVEIELWPQTEGVEGENSLSVSISDFEDVDVLEAAIFETDFLEERRTFQATGTEDSEARARGTVIIENRHWDQNQPLVEGTRFRSTDGVIFRSTDGIIVPGRSLRGGEVVPGTVEVEVVADQPGEEYNIEPTEFNLPGLQGAPSYDGVTAYSEESMFGGAIGERTVVTEEDLERARNEIVEALFTEGRSILDSRIEEGFLLGRDSQYAYRIEEENVGGRAGEALEEFTVEIRAHIEVITVREEDLEEFLTDSILDLADFNWESDLVGDESVYMDSISFNYSFSDINWSAGEATLELEFAGEVYSDVSSLRLLEAVSGISRRDAEELLNNQDFIREANVRFRPFGIGNIPEDRDRVRINWNF